MLEDFVKYCQHSSITMRSGKYSRIYKCRVCGAVTVNAEPFRTIRTYGEVIFVDDPINDFELMLEGLTCLCEHYFTLPRALRIELTWYFKGPTLRDPLSQHWQMGYYLI